MHRSMLMSAICWLALGAASAGLSASQEAGSVQGIRLIEVGQSADASHVTIDAATDRFEVFRSGTWRQLQKDAPLSWDDSLRVDSWTRGHVELNISSFRSGVVTLLPELMDEAADTIYGVPLGGRDALYTIESHSGQAQVTIHRGWLLDVDGHVGDDGLRIVAGGETLVPTGTTWAVAVDADSRSTLVVDDGEVSFADRSDADWRAVPGTMWTWSPGEQPVGRSMTPAEILLFSETIRYNGERIWSKTNLLPLLAIPAAALIICLIVCGSDDVTGTVNLIP